MPLLFLQQWIPAGTLHALGWTFLHSLWLGLLAAMFAAIIMMSTRRSTAHLRYQLLCLVMTGFIVATFVTFCYYLQLPVTTADDSVAANTAIINNVITSGYPVIVAEDAGFIEKLSTWFDANINVVVIVWALFFVMNCLKLFTGLASVNRLRQYRTKKAPPVWEDKMPQLIALLGIKQKVTLLQSALVKVPVAVGILRPVVLVPIGLLMHLPAEQAETILLHELAHIKRKDYLVNLLQRIAEAIFFFNPALLWISSLIRIEREVCCDDVVLAHTTQRRNYLEALVAFQEYTAPLPSYALGISNKKNHLLQRVKRIITLENRRAGWAERIVLLAGVLFLMAFTAMKQREHAREENKTEPVNNVGDNTLRTPLQSAQVLQTQALPGTVFTDAGDIQNNTSEGIKRTAIAVEPAKQLRLTSGRTRNISLSNLVYRDTPRVKVQPAIIQPINKNIYTIINHSYHRENNGDTKETIVAIGPDKLKYFFLKENNILEKIKVNNKNIPEEYFHKYMEVFQAVSRELQNPSGRPVSKEQTDKIIKNVDRQVRQQEEHVKQEMKRVESQVKDMEQKMEKKRIKAEENDKEKPRIKVADGKPGDGKTRIEEPWTDENKPRVQESRTSEGKRANEGKPVEETKAKGGANNNNTTQKTENRTMSLTNEKGFAIELKEQIKVDAGQWNAEGKWDVDLKSEFLTKTDARVFRRSPENIFDDTKKKFDLKPRRTPTSPKPRIGKDAKEPGGSRPDGKEKPKQPKKKVDL